MLLFRLAIKNIFKNRNITIRLGIGIFCISFLLINFFTIDKSFKLKTKNMIECNYSNNYIYSPLVDDVDFQSTDEYLKYKKLINSSYCKEVVINNVGIYEYDIENATAIFGEEKEIRLIDISDTVSNQIRFIDEEFPSSWIEEYKYLSEKNSPLLLGRMPEKEKEIIVSKDFLTYSGLGVAVDINLSIYDNIKEEYVIEDLLIVGILDSTFCQISRLSGTNYIFANSNSKEDLKEELKFKSGIEIYLTDYNCFEKAMSLVKDADGTVYACEDNAWLITMSKKEYGIFKSVFIVVMGLTLALMSLVILINLDTLSRIKKKYFKMTYNLGFTVKQNSILYFYEWALTIVFFFSVAVFITPWVLNTLRKMLLERAGFSIEIRYGWFTFYCIFFMILELLFLLLLMFISYKNKMKIKDDILKNNENYLEED